MNGKRNLSFINPAQINWKPISIRLKKTGQVVRTSIDILPPPKHHSYALSVILLAITLVTVASVSFRAVNKIFIQLNICLHLNLGCPSHATVLVWVKKQGISQFRSHDYYGKEKWVLIADESIQFGNKKILLILSVPEQRCNQGKALSYQDITPLVLKVSDSWKSEDVVAQIKEHIDLKQIAYCISDMGSNLASAFKSLNCTHVIDVNHKFSLMIKSVFEGNLCFE